MWLCSNVHLMLNLDKNTERIREGFQGEVVNY